MSRVSLSLCRFTDTRRRRGVWLRLVVDRYRRILAEVYFVGTLDPDLRLTSAEVVKATGPADTIAVDILRWSRARMEEVHLRSLPVEISIVRIFGSRGSRLTTAVSIPGLPKSLTTSHF